MRDSFRDILLFSGGLDSTAIAFASDADLLTVDYGQKTAEAELAASSSVASVLGRSHEIVTIRTSGTGNRRSCIDVPKAVPNEWWPYRNQLLVTVAATFGCAVKPTRVIIGTVREDAQYADGRNEFIDSLDALLSSQEAQMRLFAPARDITSTELLIRSRLPLEVAMLTHSCSQADWACGACDSCIKTREVLNSVYGL